MTGVGMESKTETILLPGLQYNWKIRYKADNEDKIHFYNQQSWY